MNQLNALSNRVEYYGVCIKSGADALANLPNLGKVVPARGCGHFGNETGRA